MSNSRRSLSAHHIFSIVVVALAIFLLITQGQRMASDVVQWQQRQILQAGNDALRADKQRLEQRKRQVQSDDYIESVARQDMKLAKPGEVAVIGGSARAPQPTNAPRDGWGQIFGH